MLFGYYLAQLRVMLYAAPVILLAISCHEYAHGWVSDRLGDPTPRRDGRLSLNPFHHLDPLGTLCLLLFHMGWAKPVRINVSYYKEREKGIILVSLAGPMMNFLLAFLSLLIRGLLVKFGNLQFLMIHIFLLLTYYSAVINIGFGLFNLIPLPPLDGSNVLEAIWPAAGVFYQRIRPYRQILLILLLVSGCLTIPLGMANRQITGSMWALVKKLLRIGVSVGVPSNVV
ncbi:MAG: site-2 protease family protein [Enterocloster sp.]